jgi:hypothetical protein
VQASPTESAILFRLFPKDLSFFLGTGKRSPTICRYIFSACLYKRAISFNFPWSSIFKFIFIKITDTFTRSFLASDLRSLLQESNYGFKKYL